MSTFKDPNQIIDSLGPKFDQKFGPKPVAQKPLTLTSTVLVKPLTGDEIQANLKIKEVALSDVYTALPTLDTKTNHIFFVRDDADTVQIVFVFQENGKWKLVSPTSDEAAAFTPGYLIWSSI